MTNDSSVSTLWGNGNVNAFGWRPLNISVTKVCDALQLHRSVTVTANELGVQPANVYKVLKGNGLKLSDIVNGVTPNTKEIIRKER